VAEVGGADEGGGGDIGIKIISYMICRRAVVDVRFF